LNEKEGYCFSVRLFFLGIRISYKMTELPLDEWLREAALQADSAVSDTITEYREGRVTDEDDITGGLIASIRTQLKGRISGLTWSSLILRHRKGVAAEEKKFGADILIHVTMNTPDLSYSKGVLVQSKRVNTDTAMTKKNYNDMKNQCTKMLNTTASSFIFNYTHKEMRCAPATRLIKSNNMVLSDHCIWTSYRFFLELFRCPIGDPRIRSALVRDLPKNAVPFVLNVKAILG
jgi:hypothetical protein